jgi:hypothetical protein
MWTPNPFIRNHPLSIGRNHKGISVHLLYLAQKKPRPEMGAVSIF